MSSWLFKRREIKDAIYKVHRNVAVIGFFPEPDANISRIPVIKVHFPELAISFFRVLLINAQCVNPKQSVFVLIAQTFQRSCKVVCYGVVETVIADPDPDGRLVVLRTPRIRQRLILLLPVEFG